MSQQTRALVMTAAIIAGLNIAYMGLIAHSGPQSTFTTAILLFGDTWIAFQIIQVFHYRSELKRKGYDWVSFDQANLLLREFGLRRLPKISHQDAMTREKWYARDLPSLRRVFQETAV